MLVVSISDFHMSEQKVMTCESGVMCTQAYGVKHMQIGIVGLGRMGANIRRRLMRRATGVVFDRESQGGAAPAQDGANAAFARRTW